MFDAEVEPVADAEDVAVALAAATNDGGGVLFRELAGCGPKYPAPTTSAASATTMPTFK